MAEPKALHLPDDALEALDAVGVLRWSVERFGERVALASSFGAEDMVLIDLLAKVTDAPRVFTLDTGRLPQETHDVWQEAFRKYGIRVEVYAPDAVALERLLSEHGPNLFYESVDLRKACCGVQKVEPLNRALSGLAGWICGLRREQAVTRTEVHKVQVDEAHSGILKINPLADWTTEDVWRHIRENGVPYNALHDRGYPSIGCAPCTRAVEPGEDIRAGRWWWESPEQKECGLHAHAAAASEGGER